MAKSPNLLQNAGPLEACIAALAGVIGRAIREGKRLAESREVEKLKALTGYGEAAHLLNDLTAKRAVCRTNQMQKPGPDCTAERINYNRQRLLDL